MNLLRKLIIITSFISLSLSGCRMLPPSDEPYLINESVPPAEMAEATATTETSLPATTCPAASSAKKSSTTPPGGESTKPRLSYPVSEGEMLWTIARRADVYGDPLLWPLLYQANRDQIKDPRKIYAGQILIIPRNASKEEREKTRSLARKFDIFSPE